MKKIKYYCFLALLLSLFCLNKTYAFTLKKIYIFYHCPKSEISKEIKKYIDEKKHRLYKYDIEKGFYYIQPKAYGTYTQGNYVILGVKQIEKDTFLFIQNNYSSEINRTKLLEYLNKKGFIFVESKDEILKNMLDSYTNDFINSYKNSDFYAEKKVPANFQLSQIIENKTNSGIVEKNNKITYPPKASDNKDLFNFNKTEKSVSKNINNQEVNDNIVIPEKLSEKHTKYYVSVNIYATEAFKNAKFSIDASKYTSVDPDFEQVKKGIYLRKEEIFLTDYKVKNDNLAFIYDKDNGNLKSVIITTSTNFPNFSYFYKYSNGTLNEVVVNLTPALSFNFTKNGGYINHAGFAPYMKKLEKKIKGNWKPSHPSSECILHTSVLLVINKKGELLSYKILSSSGNKDFDESGLVAIKSAAPFEPLPSFNGEKNIDLQFDFNLANQRGWYYIKKFFTKIF